MHAKLFHTRPPDQRCLDLAAALFAVSPSLGRNAVKVASDLYGCRHPEDHPALIAIESVDAVPAMKSVCLQAGIAVEETL